MLRVLIVEDSLSVQRTLTALLEDVVGIEIVGIADNGRQAVNMCNDLMPDLVTMDIFMPEMDGLEATRIIMRECPTRIVVISAMVGPGDVHSLFEAMRAGAIEVIEKPRGVLTGNYSEVKQNLVRVLKQAMVAEPEAQLSWRPSDPAINPTFSSESTLPPSSISSVENIIDPMTFVPQIICIGGSTGAPTVIMEVLSALEADYPFPIIVAQHIARGFSRGLSDWLNTAVNIPVSLAQNGETPQQGNVYIIPDDAHLNFTPDKKIQLEAASNFKVHVPSIDRLFFSTAQVYPNAAVGIILSGMGSDGAAGLLEMRRCGALTAAQNEETSVVYGMANVAVENGAVMKSYSPSGLVRLLKRMDRGN